MTAALAREGAEGAQGATSTNSGGMDALVIGTIIETNGLTLYCARTGTGFGTCTSYGEYCRG